LSQPSTNTEWQRERRILGFAGVIPFLACAALLVLSDDRAWQSVASDTLRGYAAVIASFLGAVHWGVASTADDRLAHARLRWGIMPALIAWSLLAMPAPYALIGFAVLFALILIVDRHLLPVLDDTYRQLRLQLTVAVIATLVVAAAAVSGGPA
jgi:hypothetical protein